MGAAKDIVEYAGVPRFLFSDFPLGNSAGKPHEPDTQRFTLDLALKVLESAVGPRTTVQSPLRWTEDRSRDTRENAAATVALLRAAGVRQIVLVTHASHMPRAMRLARIAGLNAAAFPPDWASSIAISCSS